MAFLSDASWSHRLRSSSVCMFTMRRRNTQMGSISTAFISHNLMPHLRMEAGFAIEKGLARSQPRDWQLRLGRGTTHVASIDDHSCMAWQTPGNSSQHAAFLH